MQTYTRRALTTGELEAMRSAEECLIGAILIDASHDSGRDTINRCALIVTPRDFWDYNERYPMNARQPRNARIYDAMLTCPGAPHQVNVHAEMVRRGLIQPGDVAWFSHCVAACPTSLDWQDYAVAVRYYSQLRRSVATGTPMPATAYRGLALD